jgi:hypothetical protein
MSRRYLTLVVALIASFAVTACGSSPTAPKDDATVVYAGGTG